MTAAERRRWWLYCCSQNESKQTIGLGNKLGSEFGGRHVPISASAPVTLLYSVYTWAWMKKRTAVHHHAKRIHQSCVYIVYSVVNAQVCIPVLRPMNLCYRLLFTFCSFTPLVRCHMASMFVIFLVFFGCLCFVSQVFWDNFVIFRLMKSCPPWGKIQM